MAEFSISLKEIDVVDLPPLAQELVALIGFGATISLIEARPGLPTYIPGVASADHALAKTIGMHTFALLVKNYGGEMLTLPNCKFALTKIRHKNVIKLRSTGYSQTEVAMLTGLTPRQIRNIEYNLPEECPTGSLF
ncbi:MAG: hypothetical protein WCK93_07545 [Nitrosomonadales bacterium]